MLATARTRSFRAKPSLRQFAGQSARRPTRRPIRGSGCLGPPGGLFDRETERNELIELLNVEPADITLVLGPRSCGKTVLLESILGQDSPHAVFVDCRQTDGTSPENFVAALLASVLPKAAEPVQNGLAQKYPDMIRALAAGVWGVKLSITLGPVKEITLSKGAADKAGAGARAISLQGLDPVFDAIRTVLDSWEADLQTNSGKGLKWPVLVIDEANRLMQWRAADKPRLDTLLAFLVSLTKAQSRCHVLMATSDYAYQDWLTEEIGAGFSTEVVIGDFPEPEARTFFQSLVEGSKVLVDDSAWAAVYKVCGGNAGDLKRLRNAIAVYSSEDDRGEVTVDWHNALLRLYMSRIDRVRHQAQGGDGYSAVQYAAAALELLNSPHNAVGSGHMEQVLVQHAEGGQVVPSTNLGSQVLRRLVQANALALRPVSTMARDIPIEGFQGKVHVIVTAPSAMHLFSMKQQQPELEAIVGKWKEHKQQALLADRSGTALAGLEEAVQRVQAEIQGVETKINDLEVQVEGVVDEIRQQLNNNAGPEVIGLLGMREEELRKKEAQLRRKEEQLRRKEEQLLNKEAQMRKEK